ncbi:LDLR chaperone MESD [Elysia marginata]|uniref:LDLR chaperone MESD n=1 Tax=Elysia marginata TaxID=1093978 RepID=A0AAV4FEF4_9GAST|nr:LDLR chaperone MESD [Elysia marginata]
MKPQPRWYLFTFCALIFWTTLFSSCDCKGKEGNTKEAEKIKKKDIRDYSDADMERLFDQWEDSDEDELEEDELPEWKREPPKIDVSKLDPSNPAELLKATKKGRTLMMFATVSGNPTEEESEKISMLWQSQMFNAHIELQRYVVGPNRILFMMKDGAKAWEVKDFLVQQERCEEVTIENQNFPGAGAKGKEQNKKNSKKDKSEL